jgi:hypothetical protein
LSALSTKRFKRNASAASGKAVPPMCSTTCPTCQSRDDKQGRKLRKKVKALSRDLTALALVGFAFVLIFGGMAAVGIVGIVKLKAMERALHGERRAQNGEALAPMVLPRMADGE